MCRGDAKARDVLIAHPGPFISAVSKMELVQGMRNRKELHYLNRSFLELGVRVIHLNPDISSRAMLLVEDHYHSHHLMLADALIAVTAIQDGLPLLSGNVKHYRSIAGLELLQFKPSTTSD
jgi:predicted nucleic acid-binding protein